MKTWGAEQIGENQRIRHLGRIRLDVSGTCRSRGNFDIFGLRCPSEVGIAGAALGSCFGPARSEAWAQRLFALVGSPTSCWSQSGVLAETFRCARCVFVCFSLCVHVCLRVKARDRACVISCHRLDDSDEFRGGNAHQLLPFTSNLGPVRSMFVGRRL